MVQNESLKSRSLALGVAALALLACSDDSNSGNASGRVVAKLNSCGLVKQSGRITEWRPESEEDKCELNCLLQAECEDFRTEFCSGDEDGSEAYNDCFDNCGEFKLVECMTEVDGFTKVEVCDGYEQCLDGRDEKNCPASAFLDCEGRYDDRVSVVYKCDGEEDCVDGEDEEGCAEPPGFMCDNGDKVPAYYECDGEPDCQDKSDETHCKLFACKDGSDMLPASYVCDLDADCEDGSDEEQGCLKLTCSSSSSSSSDEELEQTAPLMSRQKSQKRR